MYYKSMLVAALLTFSDLALAKNINFGTEVDAENVTKISTIMAQPDKYLSSPVTIKGTVVGVCKKRGCWMTIASDKRFENLRIKVRDGDMVFPMSAKGSQAIATGKLNKIEFDLERTKQIKAQQAIAKNEVFDPASVTEPLVIYQLVPTGVSILDQ
jgi:hypothetical protein